MMTDEKEKQIRLSNDPWNIELLAEIDVLRELLTAARKSQFYFIEAIEKTFKITQPQAMTAILTEVIERIKSDA